jgi:hypothetical protein
MNIIYIKLFAILFISVIYAYGGIILTIPTDRYILSFFYDRTDEELQKKSTSRHIFETTIILSVFGIVAYLGRNIFQSIPFPLDGVNGFKYNQVKEVASGSLLLWILINISPVLTNKIKVLRQRFAF